ncbi:MAG TPA: hypothetical protein VMV07_23545 [Streptosporangiaceae bacterium]|nr:hypothetical protein [Streptosporangiaceae bacterium]
MPAPVTAATVQVTLTAQGYFEDAVKDLDMIMSQVFDSQQELTSTAMITTAGRKFGSSIIQWVNDFNDIRQTLSWMADQLGNTAQQILANEQHNLDLGSQLASAQMPASFGAQY